MYPIWLRLIIAGCFLCVIGLVLFAVRSYSLAFLALPGVGIVLIAVGSLWRGAKRTDPGEEETKPGVW